MISAHLLIEDEHSRELALELSSFIVEAPAGAGKTELLTQRFLKLLQTVDAPEEVIAITFTNKAASEMKSRMMDSLLMAASGVVPEQAHKQTTYQLGLAVLKRSLSLGWNLLDTPSRLRIYTIDSLSANLARQMPLLSRFGTQPAVRDDATSFYQEAATRALDNLTHASIGPIVQSALRYFDNDTYKLTQLIADMLAKRDQWLPYTQSDNTAKAAEVALTTMIGAEIKAIAEVITPEFQASLMPIARYAASNLPCDMSIALLLDWDSPIAPNPHAISLWRALADLLLTSAGNLRKRLDKNMGLPATDEAKPFKDGLNVLIETLQQTPHAETMLGRIRQLPNASQDENVWNIIANLAHLLHIAVGELWLVFQAHGEVDFVEIAQRSLQALQDIEGNATDLALRLDYRIQHLLVDEFQDTSPTQIKLIRALTHGWQAHDGRTLFCVGDPMQSIYRFRKANVGLFLQVAKHGIGDIPLTPLKLWRNNRSCPAVVAWVNQAFATIFPDQDNISQGAIQYRPFVATKENHALSGVKFHAFLNQNANIAQEETEDASGVVNDVRQQEAHRIIEIIQQTWAEQPQAKIAVLVRARNHLEALVSEIRRNHPSLSFQAVEIEELANRQIVQDLLSLTFALHQRADRVHWLAILRAPWCGLTLADMHALVANDYSSTVLELMQQPSRLQALSEDGRARVMHVRLVVEQALQHQGRSSTSRWLHGIWLMLGGAECLWNKSDVRDVQAFFERIQQLENAGQFSPEQLAIEVQKLYAAPDANANQQLQFMTIHKSKGLEFDTVILPGLDRKTGGNEQPLLLWEEVATDTESTSLQEVNLLVAPLLPKQHKQQEVSAYDYLKTLEKERAALEDARVLYVAATRAERCLHLLGAAKVDANDGQIQVAKNTFLEMLWPVVQHQFSESLENSASAKTQAKPSNMADFVPKLIRLRHPTIPAVFSATCTPIRNERAPNTDCPNTSCLEADIGTLTHLYLQWIAEQTLENWSLNRVKSLLPAMIRWFNQLGYNHTQSQQAALHVTELLETTLNSEQGRWVLTSRASGANELAIEHLESLAVNKNVVDRTFIEGGKRWIIDYKTTKIAKDQTQGELMLIAKQYQAQLDSYAALFTEENLPIQKAVFFVGTGQLVKL